MVAPGRHEAVYVVRVPRARPQLRQLASRLGRRHLRSAAVDLHTCRAASLALLYQLTHISCRPRPVKTCCLTPLIPGASTSALPARRAAAHDLRGECRRVVRITGSGELRRCPTCAPPSPRRQVRRSPSSRLASASGAAACHAVARTAPAWPFMRSAARCAGPSPGGSRHSAAPYAPPGRGGGAARCAMFLAVLFVCSVAVQELQACLRADAYKAIT